MATVRVWRYREREEEKGSVPDLRRKEGEDIVLAYTNKYRHVSEKHGLLSCDHRPKGPSRKQALVI